VLKKSFAETDVRIGRTRLNAYIHIG